MRHNVTRIVLTLAIFAVLVAGFGRELAGAVTYTIVQLSPNGEAWGIGGGQQVGDLNSNGHAVYWNGTPASAVDLQPLGFQTSMAVGSTGTQQIGDAWTYRDSYPHAIVWSGTAASAVDLTPSGFDHSYGEGICGTQQVGYGMNASQQLHDHAFLWSGSAASAVDLNPAGFTLSRAFGTNGAQQAGYGRGAVTGNQIHALLWSGTAASVIDMHPAGLNESGFLGMCGTQFVGYGWEQSMTGRHAYVWNGTAASAVDLHPAGYDWTEANATNGSVQVGYGVGAATGGQQHAMAWSGSAASAVDLQALLGPGFSYSHAQGIDDQGNIVGYAVDTSSCSHAIMWVPVPEPGTIVLLGIGVFGLMAWTRRQRRC